MSAEAEVFLRDFHRQYPGVTSRAFARGRIDQGGSSYAWLADEVPEGAGRILDLGCGDGHLLDVLRSRGLVAEQLVGVDLSAAELEAGRSPRHGPTAGAQLVRLDSSGRMVLVAARATRCAGWTDRDVEDDRRQDAVTEHQGGE